MLTAELIMTPQTEVELYLEKAGLALHQATDNLKLSYYDVAISRSYYAMFYAASALLASQGVARSKHSGVHSAFGEYFVKTGQIEAEYAKMLAAAFDSRLDSDYDLAFIAQQSTAEVLLRDAERFVERIERYMREEGLL